MGFAALIAVLINILKLVGVVKDDTAQIWNAALNLAGLVALFFIQHMSIFGTSLSLLPRDA